MATSIRNLAKMAGVSSVTAWRVVRGQYGVGNEVRREIEALARKHGVPLSSTPAQRTPNLLHAMCSIISLTRDEDTSPRGFNRRLLSGVEEGAASCGVEMFNVNRAFDDVNGFQWPLLVNRRQLDGVALMLGDERTLHPTFPTPIPSVCIFYGPPEADVVTVDDFGGGEALGRHLYALGHRHVAYLGPETDMSLRRLSGLRAGLDKSANALPWGPHVLIRRAVGGREATRMMAHFLLKHLHPGDTGPTGFTALAVYNDHMAAETVMYLRERGIRVPEQVSVTGFDDVRPTWYDGPALTTVKMPLEEIGAEAARMLYWRLAHTDAPPRRLLITAPFVAGETTRKLEGKQENG